MRDPGPDQEGIRTDLDAYSEEIILSNLELLFGYFQRYYSRQFLTRAGRTGTCWPASRNSWTCTFPAGIRAAESAHGEAMRRQMGYSPGLLQRPSQEGNREDRPRSTSTDRLIDKAKDLLLGTSEPVNRMAYPGLRVPPAFLQTVQERDRPDPGRIPERFSNNKGMIPGSGCTAILSRCTYPPSPTHAQSATFIPAVPDLPDMPPVPLRVRTWTNRNWWGMEMVDSLAQPLGIVVGMNPEILIAGISAIISVVAIFFAAKASDKSTQLQRETHDLSALHSFVFQEYSERVFKATEPPVIDSQTVTSLRKAKEQALIAYRSDPGQWAQMSSIDNNGAWQNKVAFELAWTLEHIGRGCVHGNHTDKDSAGLGGGFDQDSMIGSFAILRSRATGPGNRRFPNPGS